MRFADIIGQKKVIGQLIRTVKNNRVSHAQLFLGAEGTGKMALAIAYARYINCKNRTDDDACGVCPSCVKYSKLVHPDLHFIYPTAKTPKVDNPTSKDFLKEWRELFIEKKGYFSISDWDEKIGVEKKQTIINTRDCNDIIQTLSYKSYESEYKVMIIWMAEKIFYAAAPKILKILEEPPDKTLFILIAESQENIINTILSRTQLVKIPPIDDEDLIATLNQEGFDPSLIRDTVRLAAGRYIEAKRIIGQRELAEQNFNRFITWMRLSFSGKMQELIDFISEISRLNRDAQKSMLVYGMRMIRESMIYGLGVDSLSRVSKKEFEFIQNFKKFIHQGNVDKIAGEINQSVYHIERNANPNILFLDLSLRLNHLLKT